MSWMEELEKEETTIKKKADFYFQKENIPKKEFVKHDSGKISLDCMHFEEIYKVLQFGAQKYAADNWQKCEDPVRYQNALERHLMEFKLGNKIDPDSKLHHLAHLACNALFLLHFELKDGK